MKRHDSPGRNILRDLAGILTGVGTLAVAAVETIAAGPQVGKVKAPRAQPLRDVMRSAPPRRRKPPEAGLPVPAVPPRGPVPLKGGAAARVEFDS
ncbi:MAG: hypothetical protein ACKO01_03690 [Erythrobacter sp.]